MGKIFFISLINPHLIVIIIILLLLNHKTYNNQAMNKSYYNSNNNFILIDYQMHMKILQAIIINYLKGTMIAI